jgi:hypothetical protein
MAAFDWLGWRTPISTGPWELHYLAPAQYVRAPLPSRPVSSLRPFICSLASISAPSLTSLESSPPEPSPTEPQSDLIVLRGRRPQSRLGLVALHPRARHASSPCVHPCRITLQVEGDNGKPYLSLLFLFTYHHLPSYIMFMRFPVYFSSCATQQRILIWTHSFANHIMFLSFIVCSNPSAKAAGGSQWGKWLPIYGESHRASFFICCCFSNSYTKLSWNYIFRSYY